MRPLEIVLVLVAFLVVAGPLFLQQRRLSALAAVIGVVMAVIQIAVEESRWQFYPVYVLLAVLALWRILRLSGPLSDRPARLPLIGGSLVVLLSSVLGFVLPVPTIPEPDGPFATGTTSWTAVDPDRIEVYDDSGDPRRVVVQAWYPTETPGDPAPWITNPSGFSSELARLVGLPGFALRHLELVDMRAVADVPIAQGEWPVVVYSHGWGGFRTVQSDYIEYLASHGFVVLSLDHTYGAAVTLFPDEEPGGGDVVGQNLAALPERNDVGQEVYQTAVTLLEQTFAEDVSEVLDQLAAGEGPSLLGSGLSLDRVGLSGHSTGGGAMYRLCLLEGRCAGALGFDPWVEPIPTELLGRGLTVPVQSIRSEEWQGNNNDGILRQFHTDSPGSEGLFVIEDTTHLDFTVQAFLTPLSELLGASGSADDLATHDAINEASLDFFDRHLRGGPGRARPSLIKPD